MTDASERDLLPDGDRRLHRALLLGMIATGAIPSPEDLASASGLPEPDLPAGLRNLARADYLALDGAGRVGCLYPFSPVPTPHVVVLGDERRFAMCSIDALGVAAMLDRAVTIEGSCARCGEVIRLDVQPGTIVGAEPPDAVVVARRSDSEPACDSCCPFTHFACGPLHGDELATASPATEVAPLAEALRHAETIFGDFLAETLPARRRRSALTAGRLRT